MRKRQVLLWITMALVLGWSLPATAINARPRGEKTAGRVAASGTRPARKNPSRAGTARKQRTKKVTAAAKPLPKRSVRTRSERRLLDSLRRRVREAKKQGAPRFDHFRDADHDGVADRVPRRLKARTVKKTSGRPATRNKDPRQVREKPSRKKKP